MNEQHEPHPTTVECPTCHAWIGWACNGRDYGYHAAGYHPARVAAAKTLAGGERRADTQRPNKVDQLRVDRGDYIRASGDCECERCHLPYYDHPSVVGFEWLRRACDGRLLKL